mgnify:CR=1 FL=1
MGRGVEPLVVRSGAKVSLMFRASARTYYRWMGRFEWFLRALVVRLPTAALVLGFYYVRWVDVWLRIRTPLAFAALYS